MNIWELFEERHENVIFFLLALETLRRDFLKK